MMMAVLKQFRVVVRSIRQHYERVEKRSGLSGSQLWAMARINSRDGMTVGELARELGVHPSTASNMLERLASLGLVTKRRAGKDQRVVRIYASAGGKASLKSAPQPLIGVLQQALSQLPPASLRALHAQMSELIEVMKVRDISAAQTTPLSDM
ncbi:MAG: MarR family transcriptional regulator [Proteobacteria bacterium]|nr:MarR family transcriptional regulator [Pseudomonadota bacterium]